MSLRSSILRWIVQCLEKHERECCPKCARLCPFMYQWGRKSYYNCPQCGQFNIKFYG